MELFSPISKSIKPPPLTMKFIRYSSGTKVAVRERFFGGLFALHCIGTSLDCRLAKYISASFPDQPSNRHPLELFADKIGVSSTVNELGPVVDPFPSVCSEML